MRTLQRKWLLLPLTLPAALTGYGCMADLRDALLTGALDYVSSSTARLVETLLPVTPPL